MFPRFAAMPGAIKSGVTLAEPGASRPGMCRATAESGLRGKLAKSVMDCGEGLPPVLQRRCSRAHQQVQGPYHLYILLRQGAGLFGLRTIFRYGRNLHQNQGTGRPIRVGIPCTLPRPRRKSTRTRVGRGHGAASGAARVLGPNLLAVAHVWLTMRNRAV